MESVPEILGQFEAFLRGKGLRLTSARRAVMERFLSGLSVMDVEGLRGPSASLATVYKTIAHVRESALIDRHRLPYKRNASWDDAAPSGRLICWSCGRVTAFRSPEMEELAERACLRRGLRLLRLMSTIAGYCAPCGAKRSCAAAAVSHC